MYMYMYRFAGNAMEICLFYTLYHIHLSHYFAWEADLLTIWWMGIPLLESSLLLRPVTIVSIKKRFAYWALYQYLWLTVDYIFIAQEQIPHQYLCSTVHNKIGIILYQAQLQTILLRSPVISPLTKCIYTCNYL